MQRTCINLVTIVLLPFPFNCELANSEINKLQFRDFKTVLMLRHKVKCMLPADNMAVQKCFGFFNRVIFWMLARSEKCMPGAILALGRMMRLFPNLYFDCMKNRHTRNFTRSTAQLK